MPKDFKTVAAIDVGSNALRMIIAQVSSGGEVVPLEDLKKTVHIGRDTFTEGKVKRDTLLDTCYGLDNFRKLMDDYQVKHYRAVATSGIREAINRDYLLEQIRLRTGLKVEVINNAEERFLTYKAIRDHLPGAQRFREEGAMIVDIGSGGVEISVYSAGYLQFTEYIRVGSLRLREILADLEQMTMDFPGIMEEFVESRIYLLRPRIEKLVLKNFIGLGGEMSTISRICLGPGDISREKFLKKEVIENLYTNIRRMTKEQVVKEYNPNYQKAEALIPSVIIFHTFLAMTKADGIYTPMVSLRHGLLSDIVDSWVDTARKHDFLNDILSAVKYIGERYNLDGEHARQVEKLALALFDQTKEIHRLTERERLYLQIAALLHDIGKFVSSNNHDLHSYNIIRFQNIMGLADREFEIIANVTRYHGDDNPEPYHENLAPLNYTDKLIVAKLAAIIKLAEALDISQQQKIAEIEVEISAEDEMVLHLITKEDILLEKWSFINKAGFFAEVLGYMPVLKVKGGKR